MSRYTLIIGGNTTPNDLAPALTDQPLALAHAKAGHGYWQGEHDGNVTILTVIADSDSEANTLAARLAYMRKEDCVLVARHLRSTDTQAMRSMQAYRVNSEFKPAINITDWHAYTVVGHDAWRFKPDYNGDHVAYTVDKLGNTYRLEN